jgi:hypothetical protein
MPVCTPELLLQHTASRTPCPTTCQPCLPRRRTHPSKCNCAPETELRLAREELQRVEERFTDLCSAPFFRNEGDLLKQTDRINMLERSTKEKEVQIEHLQVCEPRSAPLPVLPHLRVCVCVCGCVCGCATEHQLQSGALL